MFVDYIPVDTVKHVGEISVNGSCLIVLSGVHAAAL